MKKREKIVQADTPDGQMAGEALVDIVENQLRDNEPPETKQAFDRLVAMGESRENAIRYIASVLSVEVMDVMQNQSTFNRARYLRNLNALPKLPFEEER